jgi:site-specific DNA-cytosine methylase
MWHYEVLNSADFGVAQTRRRLILRAVKDALLPSLPNAEPWVGWYAAIEDLIPTLPASAFAPWQLARLPEAMEHSFFLDNNGNNFEPNLPLTMRKICEPAPPITLQAYGRQRAFIVDCQESGSAPMYTVSASMEPRRSARAWLVGDQAASHGTGVQVASANEPAFTLTTRASGGTQPRAWLSAGRVVRMTPRALARFQSLPDWYALPDRASLACTVIGNAVPSLMMRKIVEQLI